MELTTMDNAERCEYMRKYRLFNKPKETTDEQRARKKAYNASPKAKAYRVFKKKVDNAIVQGLIAKQSCSSCPDSAEGKSVFPIQHPTGDIRYVMWLCKKHKTQWEA